MPEFHLFELLENLDAGRTAKARLLEWNGSTYLPTGPTIIIHEFVGEYGPCGDRGYCYRSPESGRWEVVSGLFAQAHRLIG